ncbi:MAG: argC, partial [Bacilli bacterium]|nr:argC [Bacilli bacterium]
ETNENLKAYKVGSHQHLPEIEMQLARVTGQQIPITFTTQLVPMTRGILAAIYGQLIEPISAQELHALFTAQYQSQPFVRIRPLGTFPATKEVAGSNFCDIGVYVDSRTGRVTVISVIDNLVKGAAGQAVQNLNVMMGWSAETALWHVPIYP